MKNILHHITSGQCSVGPGFDCPYKGCNSTKKLISHYRKCRIERTRATKDRPYNCLVCSFLKRDFSYNTELFNRRKPTQGLPPAQSQIPRIISSSSAKNVTPLSPNTQKKRNRSFSHSDVDLIKSADTSNNQNVDSEDADGVGEEEIGEEVDVEGDGWNGNYKLSTANINNSSFRRRSSSCGVFDDIGGMGIGKSIREEDEEDDLSSIGSKSSAASNRSRSVSFDVPP